MTTLWRKTLADLWRERTRAVMVVLAMALGLTGFQAVLSSYAILRRELDRGYLATNPASAVLRTEGIDDALLASIASRKDVADADARRVVVGRVRTGSGDWKRLVIFVVRDFTRVRISVIRHEAGEWPPAPGRLLVERDAFQVLRRQIGDDVEVKTPAGRQVTLRVAGRVHDAGQAQARMEDIVYAYATPATLDALGEPRTLNRLYVLAAGDRFDASRVRRMADSVKGWLESRGHPVSRMDVPVPGRHPHADIMGVLLLAMASFGLLVLALSGVIVVNLLLALMATERRQIGVMKAIGGTRGQIARIYLSEAVLLGGAAVVVALPGGLAGGRALTRWMAVLLNFDMATMAVPVWVYLLVAVVGLLVPLVAAAYPVAAGTDVTVRAALADCGLDVAAFGSTRLDRLLCGVRATSAPLLLGVRNSLRRRARSVLTIGILGVAGTFFIAALSLRASMMATLDGLFGDGTYGAANRYAYDQHMLMIYVFFIVAAGVIGAVGGLGLMTATSLNVLDRRRELGVLRTIGASPAMVGAIVVGEAVFIAALSWVVAVAGAWPLTAGVGTLLVATLFPRGLDTTLAPTAVAGWLAIAVALSVVSSLAPALGASRRSIREAVSYE